MRLITIPPRFASGQPLLPPRMSARIQVVPLSRTPGDVARFLNVGYEVYRGGPELGGAAADGPEEGVYGPEPVL